MYILILPAVFHVLADLFQICLSVVGHLYQAASCAKQVILSWILSQR
jgi:hypothetical protein